MNVLILGGNGFLGTNLAKYLYNKGHSVVSFDIRKPDLIHSGVTYVEGNFFDETDIIPLLKDCDIVFHAVSTINPGNSNVKYMYAYENDFLESVRLAQFSKDYGFRLIYFSSGGTVYGRQEIQPIKENASSLPINHYGNIKLCIENTYRTFNRQIGTNIIIARIANPYGPGQDYQKGVGFIDAVLKNAISKNVLQVYGDGSVVRDYIYVDDVCKMLELLMNYSGNEEVFNIGTGVGVSQNEIIQIVRTFEPDLRVEYVKSRTIDVPKIVLDMSIMKKISNISCIKVEDGIKKYYSTICEFNRTERNGVL